VNYFDAATWTGRWPFAFLDAHRPHSLHAQLSRHGIRRALVSPLDAVFAPAPGPANRELLRGTRDSPVLLPVPVINPMLADWRSELAILVKDSRVRAVRLLPAYHNYRMNHRVLAGLAAELVRYRLRVIVQIRLIDERHEYHGLNIKPVRSAELEVFLKRDPQIPVLASGLLRSEIFPLLPKHPQLLADLAFAEWHETVRHLTAKVSVRQLAFASHTPFLITAAARAKLDPSGLPPGKLTAIASGNLQRWLDI
jgi:hypothetical protein